MSTQIVQKSVDRNKYRNKFGWYQRFALQNPRLSKVVGSVLGATAAAGIDRIGWAVEGITAALSSLFVMTLVGVGLGWVLAALSGRKAEIKNLDAQLEKYRILEMEISEGDFIYEGDVKKYQALRKLGEGGMGEVWLVKDLDLGSSVVMKRILPHFLKSEEARAQLLKEGQALANMKSHPNLVTILSYCGREERFLNGLPGFIMEYVDGITLDERRYSGHRFLESEFRGNGMTIKSLCEKIETNLGLPMKDEDKQRAKGRTYTAGKLNELIDQPRFYDFVVSKGVQLDFKDPEHAMQMVKKSMGFRNVSPEEFTKLKDETKKAIRILNRLTLEVLYPGLCPVSKGLAPERSVAIVIQVLDGLEAVHGAGLVHRDLKPANIMIPSGGKNEVPKIVDFGVVKDLEGKGETTIGIGGGTPYYMAPEQFANRKPSPQTDFWALGCMLWELLFVSRPYEVDESKKEDAYSQLKTQVEFNPRPDISEYRLGEKGLKLLDLIFNRAMDKNPILRYKDHAAFRADLEALKKEYENPVQREITLGREEPTPEPKPSSTSVTASLKEIASKSEERRLAAKPSERPQENASPKVEVRDLSPREPGGSSAPDVTSARFGQGSSRIGGPKPDSPAPHVTSPRFKQSGRLGSELAKPEESQERGKQDKPKPKDDKKGKKE
jgi:serine/threonine protein kinase